MLNSLASVVNVTALEGALREQSHATASPYAHTVIENFLQPEVFASVLTEFPAVDPSKWTNYAHVNERKFANPRSETWGATIQQVAEVLNSPEFIAYLEHLTGISGLIADPSFEGGGMHQTITGGFLNMHADFSVHPHHRDWSRRVNLLLYCNENWLPEYGGDLELWTRDMKRCEKRVAPIGNRVLIFNTDADSFHGHPDPLTSPVGVARQSLALYYFTEEEAPVVHSTNYKARPDDGAKRVLIYADKKVLQAFDWAKRRFNLSNDVAGKVLGVVDKLRRKRK